MSPASRMDTSAILAATLKILDTRGFAALSMRAVATELDVQAGSLYYHVANRQQLLRLVAEHIAANTFKRLSANGGSQAMLRQLAYTLRAELREHPGAAQVVAITEISEDAYRPFLPVVLSAFADESNVDQHDALMFVQSLYVLVAGLALAEFGNAPQPPVAGRDYYDSWFDLAVGTFLAGIRAGFSTPDSAGATR